MAKHRYIQTKQLPDGSWHYYLEPTKAQARSVQGQLQMQENINCPIVPDKKPDIIKQKERNRIFDF